MISRRRRRKSEITNNMYVKKTSTILQHKNYLRQNSLDSKEAIIKENGKFNNNNPNSQNGSTENVDDESLSVSGYDLLKTKKPNKFQRIIKFATTSNRSTKAKPNPIPEAFLKPTLPGHQHSKSKEELTKPSILSPKPSNGTIRNRLQSIFSSTMNINNSNNEYSHHHQPVIATSIAHLPSENKSIVNEYKS